MGKVKLGRFITKRRIKIGLPVFIFLLLITALVLIINNINGPAEGTILQTPSPSIYKVQKAAAVPGKFDGKYISFIYPESFSIVPSPKNSGFLEVVSLYSNNHSGKQVAIGVMRESLGNDSGVNYRRSHPEIYKQQTDSFNNVIFSKDKDGSEYTGFLVRGDLVASVSLSSTYTKDLSADYRAFIKNWQWKQ